jgi:hypothetical protein
MTRNKIKFLGTQKTLEKSLVLKIEMEAENSG